MKVRSNVSDNNAIEQKKSLEKKLWLSKETIRELKDSDLKRVAGGERPVSRYEAGLCENHNEKLVSDNNRSFEQKKTLGK